MERKESFPPISPVSVSERSDAESDTEHGGTTGPGSRIDRASREELVAMFLKQENVLTRYKTRFSEVIYIAGLLCFVI